MIIGFLLLTGGAWQLVAGVLLPVTSLTAVGAAWTLAGIANIAMSRRARSRARGDGVLTGGHGVVRTGGSVTADDLADPFARARLYRSTDGALTRGLIAIGCAAVAVGVGIWSVANRGIPGALAFWPIAMIVTGAVIGFLSLLGLLVYATSSVERSAIHPATVVILDMGQAALHASDRQPYVRFVLDVYPQGLPRYEATVQTPVPVLAVPKLVVGAQFPARVAGPDKPDAVIVDWNSPLAPPEPRRAPAAPMFTGMPAAATPLQTADDLATRLHELEALSAQGLISADEYQTQRTRILDSI